MAESVSVVTKTYGFLLRLLPRVAGFDCTHRFTLVDRLEADALEVLAITGSGSGE